MLIGIAIKVLWVALGMLLLGAAIWLLLRAIGVWFPGVLDSRIVTTVWLVVAILFVLAILYAVGGSGAAGHFP